ncbi:MAG: NAD(P)H-dependent glycerol-3-phosphate dehydrogenase [Bacteroidota bacterium]
MYNHNQITLGVIGAGSFGMAIANLLAEKNKVLLYTRKLEKANELILQQTTNTKFIHPNITIISSIEQICKECTVLFPIIPSTKFREMIKDFSPFLNPGHILIHGTKGFDLDVDINNYYTISRSNIKTMSEVIREDSSVVRVGCLAGPNLASEISAGKPAATVIASKFDEVIDLGQKYLRSTKFQVYGSNDIFGIELAGVLKNYIAIAAGAITGMNLGENAKALLITRGMAEMIYVGRALGATPEAFMGMAGIGDLIATCSSPNSRNFSVGLRLSNGESVKDILNSMTEVAEGVRTIQIVKALSMHYQITAPIVHVMYRVMFENLSLEKGIKFLMRYPAYTDAEYLINKSTMDI